MRIVHTFHGHVFHSYYGRAKTAVFITIEKALARFSTDRIVVITPQQLSEIHDNVGIGRLEQFDVIPLGIDLSKLEAGPRSREAFRSDAGVDKAEIAIGFVGRLTEIKNISMLLQAAKALLNDQNFPAARFLIVGDGHLRQELEGLSKGLGIDDRVVFLGNRDDLAEIYSGLDIVVLTSLNEGTPLSLIEAMAASRPVIATSVGGVQDLLGTTVEAFDNFIVCERGISVASGDVAGLIKGFIYLAKNERLRFDLGRAGQEFVQRNYGKERLIDDIRALYARLLSE